MKNFIFVSFPFLDSHFKKGYKKKFFERVERKCCKEITVVNRKGVLSLNLGIDTRGRIFLRLCYFEVRKNSKRLKFDQINQNLIIKFKILSNFCEKISKNLKIWSKNFKIRSKMLKMSSKKYISLSVPP